MRHGFGAEGDGDTLDVPTRRFVFAADFNVGQVNAQPAPPIPPQQIAIAYLESGRGWRRRARSRSSA